MQTKIIKFLFLTSAIFTVSIAYAESALEAATQAVKFTTESLQIQALLAETHYPIESGELIKRLGGPKKLHRFMSGRIQTDDRFVYFIDLALTDTNSKVGFFMIEFETKAEPIDNGHDQVIRADYYFQAAGGQRFVPLKPVTPRKK